MKQFITNSDTLHYLILNLGLKFELEYHEPYRICNYEYGISFFPCDESIEGNEILMMYDKDYILPFSYFPRWKPITSKTTDKDNVVGFFELFAFR